MTPDWIVVNYKIQPAVQECTRCGETAPFPFNCDLDYAFDVMKVFIKHHKLCKSVGPDTSATTQRGTIEKKENT